VTEAEHCDQVALMDEGRMVALGSPDELRRKALGGEVIDVVSEGFTPESLDAVRSLPGVRRVESISLYNLRAYVDSAGDGLPHVLNALEGCGVEITSAQEYAPSFDEVFVRLLEPKR
jgi:ABC-2 type transport system ATP-binding protein